MPRQKVIDLTQSAHGGIWATGPRDTSPANTLRRGTALHPTRDRVLRSRNGTTVEDTIAAAHTLGRFKGIRWQAATTVLYKNGVSTITGFDGTRLTLQASIPRTGATVEDYYFVAGGGKAVKYKETGGLEQNWGITPESSVSAPAAAAAGLNTKVIETFESTSGFTSTVEDGPDALERESTIVQDGTYSIKQAAPGDGGIQSILIKDVTVDLSEFTGPIASPDEDWIRVWIQLTRSAWNKMANLELTFSLGNTNYTDIYSFSIRRGFPTLQQGQGGLGETDPDTLSPEEQDQLLRDLATTTIPSADVWTHVRIPKKLFRREGGNTSLNWADVQSFRFVFTKDFGGNPDTDDRIFYDTMDMAGGGGGLLGTYKYRFTSLNSVTGNRSSPWNEGTVYDSDYFTLTVTNVERQQINITSLPATLADVQADKIEIWRTLGDGTRYFKAGEINEGVTTFNDNVADFVGFDSSTGATVLQSLELPLDNDEADDEFEDFIIDRATTFWTTSKADERGRLYYSPVGRPESKKGFIDVTNDDDPLQRIVIIAGQRIVFSIAKVFRIDGDDPYVAREIPGVPGVPTANAYTVTPTTLGIMYQAADGIRLIAGVQSRLIGFESLGPVFRGETLENITAFEGVVATFARNEYIISSNGECIAYDVALGTWRDLGLADVTALFYEHDTDTVVAGRTSNTQLIEVEGTLTDAGSNITIEWETPALTLQDRLWIIEDIYFDLDTGGASLTPTVIAKDGNVALTAITQSGRAVVSRELNRMFHVAGVRLDGNGSARMEWYGVEYELRELVLGINFPDGRRVTVSGRSDDLSSSILFDVDPTQRILDELGNLLIIDRLVVEADTNSTNITPNILLENTEFALTAVNTSSRVMTGEEIDRLGPLTGIRIDGDFTADVQVFGVELYVRPVVLGVTVTTTGQRAELIGRSIDPTSTITFEVPPGFRLLDQLNTIYFVERFALDIDSGAANVTPSIVTENGTITLAAVNTSARDLVEEDVERLGPFHSVSLAGDFTAAVKLYGVEMAIRPVSMGVRIGQQRFQIDGRLEDNDTSIIFDIDPENKLLDSLTFVPLVERLSFDVNTQGSASGNITAKILVHDADTITLSPAFGTAARESVTFNVNRLGKIRGVQLDASFDTEAIAIYGVELIVNPLVLNVRVLSSNVVGNFRGSTITSAPVGN